MEDYDYNLSEEEISILNGEEPHFEERNSEEQVDTVEEAAQSRAPEPMLVEDDDDVFEDDDEDEESSEETEEESIESVVEGVVSDVEESAREQIAHIQENPVDTVSTSSLRFSGAEWFDKIRTLNVTLIGCGGIGSWTAMLLARTNIRSITLYDGDRVDYVNMAGQLLDGNSIGAMKPYAVSNICRQFITDTYLYARPTMFTNDTFTDKITICGLDNMSARKIAYNRWKQLIAVATPEERREALFIDGRMAAESYQIFCIRGNDTFRMQRYERDWLFDDSEADATVCSYKQTSYMAALIAGNITNLVVNHAANLCEPLLERDITFFTEYDGVTRMLKTEM